MINYTKKKNRDPDNFEIMKELKKEQTQLRLMQSELTVEEIVKDRSLKYFTNDVEMHTDLLRTPHCDNGCY